ncbi:hypothetical protein J6590_081932 [Homalodisca vitripennis]|nr:hypothetical protein J6590_081932 [Homalodisca vitripennis]
MIESPPDTKYLTATHVECFRGTDGERKEETWILAYLKIAGATTMSIGNGTANSSSDSGSLGSSELSELELSSSSARINNYGLAVERSA